MATTDFRSVDEYIATKPEDVQAILQRVRTTIRTSVPGAEEVISYQIPAYKLNGATVLFFAGWKQHYSLYPASGPLVKAFKAELAPYELSKGTIRFPARRDGARDADRTHRQVPGEGSGRRCGSKSTRSEEARQACAFQGLR